VVLLAAGGFQRFLRLVELFVPLTVCSPCYARLARLIASEPANTLCWRSAQAPHACGNFTRVKRIMLL
jgi:hypothetical protein